MTYVRKQTNPPHFRNSCEGCRAFRVKHGYSTCKLNYDITSTIVYSGNNIKVVSKPLEKCYKPMNTKDYKKVLNIIFPSDN